ncbi:hypothetical protein Golomagni_06238 [Golovinomyces magnicellulatus]|nr:hypothetical protein Golomagni_06238 [Golovinomyces magnicellulatus]
MPHDNESNVNSLNSDDKVFHHDGEVTIANPPVRMYRSLEEVESAPLEFSRGQRFEITRGGRRRKNKFVVLYRGKALDPVQQIVPDVAASS